MYVLYRFRIRAGTEEEFRAAWSRLTLAIRKERRGLGSRLHRGEDGIWYAYAHWPDRETRAWAFDQPSADPESQQAMRDCIEERLPEVVMDATDDLLSPGSAGPA